MAKFSASAARDDRGKGCHLLYVQYTKRLFRPAVKSEDEDSRATTGTKYEDHSSDRGYVTAVVSCRWHALTLREL